MATIDYPVFDADNHYYETRDAFTRHMEPRLRDKAIHFRTDASGRDILMIGERPFTFLENLFQDRVAPPGMRREYVERAARLACMDRQGLQSALMFPTIGVCVEHFMKHDPEQIWANLRAFNRWLEDDWGFAHRGRIFAAPLLSLLELDRAVAELDWSVRPVSEHSHPQHGDVFVSPYHEEDIPGLARLIGPSQVLFGSDWPHPEGMAEPAAFAAELEGLSTAEIAQIMHGNSARLVSGQAL